jgi:glycosyltransferase involved in cell wall biosynthesis
MIKVAHLTSVHDAADARITHKECATLSQAGYDVVVIAPEPKRTLPFNIRHRTVPAPRNRFERFSQTVRHVYRAAREERADVYHFHDPELIPVGIALQLGGARMIFDVHEDIPLDIRTKAWIPRALQPIVSAAATTVLRYVQKRFTAIVPATPSIAESFTHPRTIVVRNYPRLEELALDGAEIPYHSRPNTAIYLGNITLVRGLVQMVNAMADARLPADARLLLAGEFEDATLRDDAAALTGWPRVDAPGRIARNRLGDAMNGARIGLLVLQPTASFEQSLPTKLFEYMAAGLPVIISRTLACREIVERHQCGIVVDPRDSAEIATAMCRLFEQTDEARAMGERGRQAVYGRYEWDSEGRTLLKLYHDIVTLPQAAAIPSAAR